MNLGYIKLPTGNKDRNGQETHYIIFNHFKYYMRTVNKDNSTYWTCRAGQCSASISLTPGGDIIKINGRLACNKLDIASSVRETHTCNKELSDDDIALAVSLNDMVRRSTVETTTKLADVHLQESIKYQQAHPENKLKVPDLYSLKNRLYRARRKNTPVLPKSLKELKIIKPYNHTLDVSQANFLVADHSLFVDREKHRITIFASDAQLRVLGKCERWNVDGTFAVCPNFYKQVYIIMGIYREKAFPLVFALLTRKHTDLYLKMIGLIIKRCEDIDVVLAPVYIMSDFELPAMNAFRMYFPTAECKGCYFHFCQALWRKWDELGLGGKAIYKDNVKVWYKKMQALAFVSLDKLLDAFTYLHDESAHLVPGKSVKVEQFCDYMVNNWVGPNPRFSPAIWNCHELSDMRTNNHLERFII